jgi:hypothetical protein
MSFHIFIEFLIPRRTDDGGEIRGMSYAVEIERVESDGDAEKGDKDGDGVGDDEVFGVVLVDVYAFEVENLDVGCIFGSGVTC